MSVRTCSKHSDLVVFSSLIPGLRILARDVSLHSKKKKIYTNAVTKRSFYNVNQSGKCNCNDTAIGLKDIIQQRYRI